jgi:DTW domain-containing protein YfiP
MSRHASYGHRCPDCRMHLHICVCDQLPVLPTRTRVLLLVHQLELRKTTNTGLLALRCLPNSACVMRGRLPETPSGGPSAPPRGPSAPSVGPSSEPLGREPGRQAVLLYPGQEAVPLASFADSALPLTLIVPDGTWSQASRTRRRVAGLADLPCVALPAGQISGYELRHAGQPGRLSTMEAIARALGVLEGPAVEDALLKVHRLVVERTLWTNGRLPPHLVTGGLPEGARPHDPRSGLGGGKER